MIRRRWVRPHPHRPPPTTRGRSCGTDISSSSNHERNCIAFTQQKTYIYLVGKEARKRERQHTPSAARERKFGSSPSEQGMAMLANLAASPFPCNSTCVHASSLQMQMCRKLLLYSMNTSDFYRTLFYRGSGRHQWERIGHCHWERVVVTCIDESSAEGPPRSISAPIWMDIRRFSYGWKREVACFNSSVKPRAAKAHVDNAPGALRNHIKEAVHLAVSLGLFLVADKALKIAFAAAGIRFPSALFGMFSIFSFLLILDSLKPVAASTVVKFFEPATTFIQRWLPLFYVPSLVILPLAVKGIPAASAAKIGAILVGGWVASLCVAGYTAVVVRKMVKTEVTPADPMPKAAPFSIYELWSWTVVLILSFTLTIVSPTAFGTIPLTTLPYFLAATVLGYILGSRLPSGAKQVLHPIITCAMTADLAAFAFGVSSGSGFISALGAYLTKKAGNPGAGDVLMGFLGSVIISFAFSMFRQRKLVKRHAAEIFTAVVASSIFSLYSTAAVGRLMGLDPSLSIAIVPRCITVALALSIADLFEVTNTSLTAAVVVLTGLVGANFAQNLLDRLHLKDPIARGLATASSAHGLGTAALSAKEPEALPFCAIAYALTGIFCSLLCSIPTVRQSLLLIVGA